jgi:hypothetical protein
MTQSRKPLKTLTPKPQTLVQEIKLNDNDRGEEPPKGDPSAPE